MCAAVKGDVMRTSYFAKCPPSVAASAILLLAIQSASANTASVSAGVDRGSAALSLFIPVCGTAEPCPERASPLSRYGKQPFVPASVQPMLVKNPFLPAPR
jgi:hypothetical protein